MAVQAEWLGTLRQINLTTIRAFGNQCIGADETFIAKLYAMSHSGINRKETIRPNSDDTGDIGAGSQPAVVPDRRVVPDHGTAPDEDIIPQPYHWMDVHLVHDEAVVTVNTVGGQTRFRVNIGCQGVAKLASLVTFCCAQGIHVLIAKSHEHVVCFRRMAARDFVERDNGYALPFRAGKIISVHGTGYNLAVAVVSEKIQQHFRDFAGAKEDDRFHGVQDVAMNWGAIQIFLPLAFIVSKP